MTIVDGVIVDRPLAPVVLRLIAEGVRRDPSADSIDLRKLRAELDRASARTSVADIRSTSDDGTWLTPREAARRLGVTERTIRRRAAAGSIDAKWEDGRRWIRI